MQSEYSRMMKIMESIPDCVYIVGPDFNIQYINSAIEKDFGTIQGRKCYQYFHDRTELCPWCKNEEVLAGKTVDWEWHSSKHDKYYRLFNTPFKNSDDSIAKLTIFQDITKRKQAEKRLQLQALVLDQIDDHVTITDLSGVIIYVNDMQKKSLGYSRDECIGQTTAIYGDDPKKGATQKEILQETLQNGSWRGEVVNCSKNGREIIMNCRTQIIRDSEGNPISLCGIATDITKHKQIEKKLLESEQKYRLLAMNTMDVIWTVDLEFKLTFVNKAIYHLLGYTPEEFMGMSPSAFILPEGIKTMKNAGEQVIAKHKKGEHFQAKFEIQQICKNGSIIDVEVTGNLLQDDAGQILGFQGRTIDITESKQAVANRNQLLTAIEHTSEAIIITDCEGKIQYVNPGFEKTTGYSQKEVIGKNPRILQSGEQDESFYHHMWQTITSGDNWQGRLINRKKDNTLYTEHASISPVINKMGEVINFVAVKRDITDEIIVGEKIHQAQKMESIGTLAGGIAHDFNNILFPIIGYTEMLMEDIPENSPFYENLKDIYTGSLRARDLVKQILAFSRQENNDLIVMKIQPIIKEALKLIRSTIPTTIAIKQNINSDCGLIKADPTQIHQIIMNLSTNAYHAMEETGGELKISLKKIQLSARDMITFDMTPGAYACLTIADTGIGMDKELIKKIFDPFFTTKTQGKGTGMGLSVVHGITTTMGGAVQVYSEPGKGTEFKVYFPIEKNSLEKPNIQTNMPVKGGTEHILLVDDEKSIVTTEKQMLERLGYKVTSFTNSIEALEAFRATPATFDIVISDVAMPNISGDKLAVKLIKIRPDIPILLCTGFSGTVSREKAAAIGIQGFLLKPITNKLLSQKIREVLDKN